MRPMATCHFVRTDYDRAMMKRLAAALGAALLLPASAGAQTMDFACPEPGTTFIYDSGTKVTAKGREGMDCLMEIVDGKPQSWLG